MRESLAWIKTIKDHLKWMCTRTWTLKLICMTNIKHWFLSQSIQVYSGSVTHAGIPHSGNAASPYSPAVLLKIHGCDVTVGWKTTTTPPAPFREQASFSYPVVGCDSFRNSPASKTWCVVENESVQWWHILSVLLVACGTKRPADLRDARSLREI